MYTKKLVASIRANGKILREFKDTVYIPFGSEYSILLKNLNTVRALINIYIDGDNIVPGGLVLNAGQEIDLQRAIRNGNLTEGNRLKFIERTSNIEDHRGIKLEDGIIKIEFQFEKIFKRQDGIQWNQTLTWTAPTATPYYGDQILRSTSSQVKGHTHPGVAVSCADFSYTNDSYDTTVNTMLVGSTLSASSASIVASAAPQNETGITVAGSKSEQKFVTVSNFTCEPEKHNIILKLLGETADNKEVREPIHVKKKPKCTTCGKQNKATSRYCGECGTALEIFA